MTDKKRLDLLEKEIRRGTVLWDGVGEPPGRPFGRLGIGINNRTLRQAIDYCLRDEAPKKKKSAA